MSSPKKNVAYVFNIALVDSATGDFKASPTLAAGDFKVSGDGAVFADLATLPVVDPTGSIGVKISLSQTEMNFDKIMVQCIDVAGAEWDDTLIFIDATVANVDDIVRSTTPANTLDIDGSGDVTAENMRGTDSAALASVCTEVRLAELAAANLPTDVADIPTVAEFNARTLVAADYFDPVADAVANVTLVATVTTLTGHTAQTGDNFARLGTPVDADLSADIAANQADLNTIITNIGALNDITANQVADAYLDRTDGVESGLTPREHMRVVQSGVAGKSSGHAAGTPKYRDKADTKDRIDATTDIAGNRTAVTLDLT